MKKPKPAGRRKQRAGILTAAVGQQMRMQKRNGGFFPSRRVLK
jgi:hypothetical protein